MKVHSFRAMGTDINFWLETADSVIAQAAFNEAESLFHSHERVLSRFQTQSELSQLNRCSGKRTVVSPLLYEPLSQALAMAELTAGLFDPTILNGLQGAGYIRSFELLQLTVPSPTPAAYPTTAGNWQDIILNPIERSVFQPRGLQIDLGGIAKGYTAQKAVALLGEWGPCLVDAGGDITAGAAPSGSEGWPIAVNSSRACEPRDDLFNLYLANASLATSGIDHRFWQHNGRTQHHLIDPKTSQPASTDLLTVTIWAKSAAVAEAWATAAIILGAESGTNTLVDREIPAALITQSQKLIITPAMAHFAGLVEPSIITNIRSLS